MESNKPDMGFRLPMWLYVCSCILQINIFELSWVEFAFPPFKMVPQVLQKIAQSPGVRVILIAPLQQAALWFPEFLSQEDTNLFGSDLCLSVGRKDGSVFESEAIISVHKWCICSETDFSQRRFSHCTSVASVLCHWVYSQAADPHIKLLIRAFRLERPVQRRIMPKQAFILCFHLYWYCHSHQSAIFKGNPRMTSFPLNGGPWKLCSC